MLPWLEGMLGADAVYFKTHGVPFLPSHSLTFSAEPLTDTIEISPILVTHVAVCRLARGRGGFPRRWQSWHPRSQV